MSPALGTILITGATGFIGAALATRLSGAGARGACLSRRIGPTLPGFEYRLPQGESAGDIARAIGDLRPDVVLHLAAAGVHPQSRDPEELIRGNVGLTTSLIQALAERPPRRFIQVGSCSEYAPIEEPARIREDHPLDPTSLYGAAKASAFFCGRALASRVGVPFVALRLFGVIGPGEGPHRLIPHLLAHYQKGAAPPLSPGEQARDLAFVDDVVEALLLAATSPAIEVGTVYNICTGIATRVREVARLTAQITGYTGSDLGLGQRPYRDDEPMWIVGDPTKFASATGFHPRVSVTEAVRRMAELALARAS